MTQIDRDPSDSELLNWLLDHDCSIAREDSDSQVASWQVTFEFFEDLHEMPEEFDGRLAIKKAIAHEQALIRGMVDSALEMLNEPDPKNTHGTN